LRLVRAATIATMSRKKNSVEAWNDGRAKLLSGFFTIENGVITVTSSYGAKSTELGGLPPLVVARVMLPELADDADSWIG
jgi:hypothetical protein